MLIKTLEKVTLMAISLNYPTKSLKFHNNSCFNLAVVYL